MSSCWGNNENYKIRPAKCTSPSESRVDPKQSEKNGNVAIVSGGKYIIPNVKKKKIYSNCISQAPQGTNNIEICPDITTVDVATVYIWLSKHDVPIRIYN